MRLNFKKIVKSYHKSLDEYEIFLKVITGLEDTKKQTLFTQNLINEKLVIVDLEKLP